MQTDKAWQIWAETEPYFGVLTDPAYLSSALDDDALEQFYASGQQHMRSVFTHIRQHINSGFQPGNGLDFGCGTGRLAYAMADHCTAVTGVDVAPAMLQRAAAQSERSANANLRWQTSAEFLADDQCYDFINSHLVFQHIRPHQGMPLLERLLQRLQPGGVIALGFAYHNDLPMLRRGLTWLRNRMPWLQYLPGARKTPAPMEMNIYDLNALQYLFARTGIQTISTTSYYAEHISYVTFFGRRDPQDPP